MRSGFDDRTMLDAMRARVTHLRSHLQEAVHEIETTLYRFDPVTVLAVGFARYALKDPESYEEPDHFAVVPLEHAAVIYSKKSVAAPEPFDYAAVVDAFNRLDEITLMWAALHPELDGSDALTSIRGRIMMHETMVRMPAFAHQIEETARALFAPFAAWMGAHLGFTVDAAFRIIHSIERRAERVFNAKLALVRREFDALPPSSRASFDFTRVLGEAITPVLTFEAAEMVQEAGLPSETVARFLAFFTLEPEDVPADYTIPSPALPLKTKPIMRIGDRYLVPSAMLVDTAVQPAIEHSMNPSAASAHAAATESVWQVYVSHRKDYSEKRTLELLARVLPGTRPYRDLKYHLDSREYDLDGLALFERCLILVEVKAGNFSLQARFGDPDALVGDVKKLIDHPHEQAERALRFLSVATGACFRCPDGSLLQVDRSTYDRAILITVTLDDLGQLTAAYNELPKPARSVTPWAVSLHDLEVITDHVGTAAEFLQYIARRIAVTDLSSATTFDELEWLGKYLSDSLDDLGTVKSRSTGQAVITGHTVDLNSYYLYKSGVRHTFVEKPRHQLPTFVRTVLDDMQRSAVAGWLACASVLLEIAHLQKERLNRKVCDALERGRPTMLLCRSAEVDIWVKIGTESNVPIEERLETRQLVLELTRNGLLTAAYVERGSRITFASESEPTPADVIPLRGWHGSLEC
jgi:hypothetical protein